MLKNSILIIISILLISACKTIEPMKPVLTSSIPIEIEVAESFINLPVEIDLKQVETVVNQELGAELYNGTIDNSDKGNVIKLKVNKTNQLTLSTVNGKINFSLGLQLLGNIKQSVLFTDVEKDFDVSTTIDGSVKISFDENWNVSLGLSTDVKLKTPVEIGIIGLKVGITSIVESIINKQLALFSGTINDEISKAINLRQEVEKIWQTVNEAFLITETPVKVWALMQPTACNLSPIKTLNINTLLMNIGLKAKIQTKIGSKPTVKNSVALPKLQQSNTEANKFQINLPVSVEISEMKEVIKKEMNGKTFPIPNTKRSITINDIDVYGAGNQTVLMLDVKSKKLKGKLYLLGTPVYNDSTKVIEIQNLDFSTETNRALVNSASWLISKLFLKTIQQNARYDVSKDLIDAQAEIEKSLNTLSVSPLVKLNCKISKLNITNLIIQDNILIINVLTSGVIDAKVK